jgi:sugar lactone lactonase YvrE
VRNSWLIASAVLVFIDLGWALRPVPSGGDIEVTTSIATDRRLKLHYSLQSDSFVTLVIDDDRGKRVRNLIGAEARKSGPNVELWDGTDDQGQPVAASSYRWRILRHSGVDVEYVMSYGNPGSPPWATADGKGGWGGDHTWPQAAVATPEGVILGWPMAESGWFLFGVGQDGHKQWGLKNRFAFGDTRIALATDREYLYVASEQNPEPLQRYYKKLAHAVLYRYRLSDRRLAKFGNLEEIVVTDQMDGNVSGVAVTGDTAYVALRKENRVAAISLLDGKATPERDLAIPSPTAVAIDKSGGLIVLSGHQAVRINLKARESHVLIPDGLEDPAGLYIDESGSIYVSDRGESQQVKVFAAAGKPLRTIGIAGGRPPRGPHQAHGMYRPLGIAVDDKEQLWVMEEDDRPKRVSVWNAATGGFLREYIGPPRYGALDGSVADFDKTMGFGEGVQYRLDWDNKTYQFAGTPSRGFNNEDVFGRAAIRRIFQIKGRVLTASNSHVQVVAELKDGVLHPLAAVGGIDELTRRQGMYTGAVSRKIEQLKRAGANIDAKGNPTPAAAFIWIDQNGDGIAQDSEFVWRDKLNWGGYWGTSIGQDLAIFMQSAGMVYRLPATGWTAHGAPIYTFESATTIPYRGSAEHVAALNDGTLIVNAKPQLLGFNIASRQQVWSYPNIWQGVQGSHMADVPAPGRLIGPLYITGSADLGGGVGTVFAMNGNLGQQFLMTSDGMWIGAVLRDWRLAKGEDMYTVPDEDFGGYFWRDQATGDVFLEAGKSEYRLYRVKGLDTIRRSGGEFTVSSELATAAAIRAANRKAPRQNIPSVAIVRLTQPFKVSGKLEDVPQTMRFTEVVADDRSNVRFALSHDLENLYLAYDVTDDTPFQNDGHDLSQMFTTGDCVDLMYGVDPKADPHRKEGAAGDNRLLLTIRDGKPLAVLYKQVDSTRSWPVRFMSPSRAIYFGGVVELHDARIAMTRSKTGYVLTASVPLATLGINPEAASSFLIGDVGVIFGSESGNGARLRLYWANKETAITSDIPSEAALAPANWGRFRFE